MGTGSFLFLSFSFSFFPGGCVREQMGISLYMLVGGDEEWGPVLFAPSPGPWGVCVCIFGPVWTDGGADAKDERRRPAGKQRDEMYCFFLGGLDLLMLSSQGTHSCGRLRNVPVWQLSCSGGGGGREIYMLAVVFLHCVYGELLPDI